MRLVNLSPFSAGLTIAVDKDGREHILVVSKGTFDVNEGGKCTVAAKQEPMTYADRCHGDPGLSSVIYESDFALHKPATDVLVNGSAYSIGGLPTEQVDVTLEVATIRKTVRVYGDRCWQYFPFLAQTPPQPFLSMPLLYERSFGGPSHPGNPIGVGFRARPDAKIDGSPVPNLENPNTPIRKPTDTIAPTGFGIIARNWRPRASYAGTYDQSWLEHVYPFLPPDFDDRFFMSAPEDQICNYLGGGERVTLINATPEGRFAFRLPAVDLPMTLLHRRGTLMLNPVLDTVLIEPDLRRCMLTWRASNLFTGKLTDVSQIWIGTPTPGRKRAMAVGKRYLDWSQPTHGKN